MADNVLVVEYEPRYADRVRHVLAAYPVTVSLARDGEEAMRALDAAAPRLVVLSSVIPKGNPNDLIRAIRGRNDRTPILLTVSGYNGTAPAQDAMRMGVTDILPKPYTEAEFLGKVQTFLGAPSSQPQLTSSDIFGDIIDERPAAAANAAKKPAIGRTDIDKMVADRLGDMRTAKTPTSPGTGAKAKSTSDLNKLVEDTLSGLERKKTPARPITMTPPPASAQAPPDRIPVSQPVFPAAATESAPLKDEPEPTDGTRFGQYVMLEKIATGGMAEVWKARKRGEEGFQKIVAIKKILPHLSDNQDFIEMFIDEAKLAAQLNHNNIIHIYDLGKIQNSYYIAMEYVDGHDLKAILKRGQERDQPLGVELSLFIAAKIAAALDYAHRKRDFDQKEMGLVHRDVSPQNVLISHDGDIKLCDFGIAKAASKASHTQAGALKGKLQYMSPEQAWGRAIDRRSDIFALAAVLFEMLTGRKLFTGESEISILEQVREARITKPSELNDEVTPEIDAIVLKALEKDPASRYQTAGEMAKDIEAVLYTFRPTPTSADLAIYMHRIWSAEAAMPPLHGRDAIVEQAPPVVVAAPIAAAAATATTKPGTSPGVVPMPAWDAPAHATARVQKKRSVVAPLAIVALLVAAIVAGFFYVRSRPADAASTSPAATANVPPASTVVASSTTPAETGTLVPVPGATTNTVPPALVPLPLDPGAVDLEVQRRLAAERARLEQQALAQRQQTATIAPLGRTPAQQVATQTAAPPPVEAPAPAPVTPVPAPPTPAVAEANTPARPAADTAPAPAQVREGDLVPQGTAGLTPGRVIRLGSVSYPPMARARRVQGTVLMSVLISERGEVLDVRMIRGIPQPVGLNEAAEQVIRRSTFAAPMMSDGTRVKAWATVPVKFEL